MLVEKMAVYNWSIRMDVVEKVVKVLESLLIRWHHVRRNPYGHVRVVVLGKLHFVFLDCRRIGQILLLVGNVGGCSVRTITCI